MLTDGTIDLSNLPSSEEEEEPEPEPEPAVGVVDIIDDDDSDSLPGLVEADTGACVLSEWSQVGHPIRKLLTTIADGDSEHILDPSWCVEDCYYGSGTLACQRFTLLRRLYQIQLQLDFLEQKD
jgi:hypothetical protein